MIGSLRHRVELLAPARSGDGGGGASVDYSVVDEVAAEITPRRAGQHRGAGFAVPVARYRVTLRHHTDLHTNYRLRFDGRDHRILDVQKDDNRTRLITLDVEEVVR